MALVQHKKRYGLVHVANSELVNVFMFTAYHDEGDTPPVPSLPEHTYVEISDEDLGGLTEQQFKDSRKPVLVSGVFSSWSARASAPALSVDIDPPDDGSLACTVTINSGTANSSYRAHLTRGGVSCNLQDCLGSLDAQGDGSFKLKVFGPGDFTVKVLPHQHSEFEPAELSVHVVAGGF